MNEITMKQKLLQQCIIVSCNKLSMLPSYLPRHPSRGRQLGTNSLVVIVSSDMIWLQHKASCYRGHGYPNRLSSLQGCTSVILHARISRVAYTLSGNAPPRLSDMPRTILRLIREVPTGLQSSAPGGLGPSPLALRVVVRQVYQVPQHDPTKSQ